MMSKCLRRFGGLILSVLLLPGFIPLLATTSAEAQRRRVIVVPVYRRHYNHYTRYRHYIFDNSGKAYSQGYRDGQKTGAGDLKNQRTFNPQRSHYFEEARFGNFGEVYRSGFARGYANGFGA